MPGCVKIDYGCHEILTWSIIYWNSWCMLVLRFLQLVIASSILWWNSNSSCFLWKWEASSQAHLTCTVFLLDRESYHVTYFKFLVEQPMDSEPSKLTPTHLSWVRQAVAGRCPLLRVPSPSLLSMAASTIRGGWLSWRMSWRWGLEMQIFLLWGHLRLSRSRESCSSLLILGVFSLIKLFILKVIPISGNNYE